MSALIVQVFDDYKEFQITVYHPYENCPNFLVGMLSEKTNLWETGIQI
jgi:hypothetical protein